MNWLECGAVLLVAVVTTIALTPVAKAIAKHFDAIDYPDKRRINTKPIPRMGGVALFGGMIAACIVLTIGINAFGWQDLFHSRFGMDVNYPILALGVCFMFAVGFVDDIVSLDPRIKFVGQVIASCIAVMSGLLLSNIQNPLVEGGFIEFGIWAYPITVFYLVAFANIINLIDGLDGLASGISALSAGTIFVFAAMSGRFESAMLSIIIVGVCLGFLKSNHYPASVFMGDSGSLLLGISLGIVSLLATARSTLVISLLVPIITAGVPVIDTAVAIIRRKRAHQSVIKPDTGHIHHRLLKAGFSQRSTVFIMWGWTALLAVCSLVLAESEGISRIVAVVIAAIVTGYAIGKLHLLEPVLRHHYHPRNPTTRHKKSAQSQPSDTPADAHGEIGTPPTSNADATITKS